MQASIRSPVALGTRVGLCIGAVGCANHAIEIAVALPTLFGTILGAGMWAVMFVGFGVASSATIARGASPALGVLASAWSGMIYAVVLVTFAVTVGLVFMPHMQRILIPPSATVADPSAFVIRRLMDNALSHLLLAPAIATVVGIVSAAACVLLRSVGRRTAAALGLAAVVLLLAGVGSIQFASGLARSARPPFIQFGLGALCLTLASAHAVLTAVRRHG